MEVWRSEVIEGNRPKVLCERNVLIALGLHVAVFIAFYIFAALHGLFDPKETIIPIDLTVVVNENLEGKENEPPPLKNPDPPEPPKPKPKPKPKPEVVKKPDPPKALEQMVTNIVVKKEAKKEPEKKEPEKKKEPEPPKKTAAEIRQERIKQMRERAKVVNKAVKIEVKNARESGNGRTEKQQMTPDQIRNLLNQGYRPGTKTQLAASEEQRCVSLIQMALNEKWDAVSPKIGRSGTVLLSVQFNSSGGMINVRISKSCGDKMSDDAARSVAQRVTSIPGLSAEFIAKFRKEALVIRYDVRSR